MAWVGLITAVLKLLGIFNSFLMQQQLIDGAHAQAISEGLQATLANIAQARRAADAVEHPDGAADDDYARRLRDKYTRPDG